MTIDHTLISRAQQKTTGQNIHKISNLMSNYESCVKLIRLRPKERGDWTTKAKHYKDQLTLFVNGGIICA